MTTALAVLKYLAVFGIAYIGVTFIIQWIFDKIKKEESLSQDCINRLTK